MERSVRERASGWKGILFLFDFVLFCLLALPARDGEKVGRTDAGATAIIIELMISIDRHCWPLSPPLSSSPVFPE